MVDEEKKKIYEPCIEDISKRYNSKYGDRNYEVIGLWLGSRGAISTFVQDFFRKFNLNPSHLANISESILKDSIHIIHNHIYKVN